jgi:AcrR family transcriptional regulator
MSGLQDKPTGFLNGNGFFDLRPGRPAGERVAWPTCAIAFGNTRSAIATLGKVPCSCRFDEQDIIDHAMELFWTRGYEATSVADLTAELGVHPGSLYRTFGDKHALFLRALARYREVVAKAAPDPRRLIRGADAALAALAQVR